VIAGDLVTHLARFARALRSRGVTIGLSDEADAAAALTLVDIGDRAEVRQALLVTLKIRPRDRAVFDELFARLWTDRDSSTAHDRARVEASPRPDGRAGPPRLAWGPGASAPERHDAASESETIGYSPEALLRRKPFDECSERELAEMESLLARLALRLATRRSRRLVPTRGRGLVDLRRSFRRAVGSRGEFVSLARRTRAVDQPRLVVLCDTSGSMDQHTRFLLTFILSLKRTARRTEVFAFNTSLTRLTPWLSAGKIRQTLERLSASVPDWSGGTRIGECLAAFVERYQDELVTPHTVVVILSDGLDRGETAPLVEAMRALRAKARRVIWLNPLLGDPRYRPEARGMAAALPYVDCFAPAHNLESLERLVALVAN
jgi:uncharacterized protein with von Willebrand factor type A (vWA) domain